MAKTVLATDPEETAPAAVEPLAVEPASLLADRKPPAPRDWICEGLGLPAARVTSLIGNGGFGKSTIAHQIALAVATGQAIFGMKVSSGPVFGLFCEDEAPELDRKTRAICRADNIELESLDNAFLLSRDGNDNVICCFDRDQIQLTDFYWQLDATIASIKPRLTILDTTADIFAGDFMSTPHVRQFIKVALGGICLRHETAVLLLAHPSASAMASGDGAGFSTAWNNSVRSRLYLRRPKSDDTDAITDRRVLEIKKANYGPSGATVPLLYSEGRFILDPEPIPEVAKKGKAPRVDTRLSLAVMGYFNAKAPNGEIVAFREIFESLQKSRHISHGDYETVRKPLQRSLKDLAEARILGSSKVPRGYRLLKEFPP
jgi:hypothetical protein